MNRVPEAELILVPGGTLITDTPEQGRALAMKSRGARSTTSSPISIF